MTMRSVLSWSLYLPSLQHLYVLTWSIVSLFLQYFLKASCTITASPPTGCQCSQTGNCDHEWLEEWDNASKIFRTTSAQNKTRLFQFINYTASAWCGTFSWTTLFFVTLQSSKAVCHRIIYKCLFTYFTSVNRFTLLNPYY